jgi:chaperone BCS1
MNGQYGGAETIDKSIGLGTHFFIYKKRPLKVTYNIEKTVYSHQEKIHINLTKFGRSHKLFDDLKDELQDLIKSENEVDKLVVYSFDKDDFRWTKENKVRKRDFNTIFIEDDIKNRLLNHLDKFYASEDWYHSRGIPYQTGICLYGPAGTGKTSIVKALASNYSKNLCILRSSEINNLPQALRSLPSDSFIVIEDIDTSSVVMERNPDESLEDTLYNIGISKKRRAQSSEEATTWRHKDATMGTDAPSPPSLTKNDSLKNNDSVIASYTKVLLSDVLNAMDGLVSIDKRVIVFTTNHIEKLDRALIRPGRIDCLEKIDFITYEQFVKFCHLFYDDTITDKEKELLSTEYYGLKHCVTVAELQKNFMQGMKLDKLAETYCNHK